MQTLNVEKLAINIDQQSTLAKLLAQENITVIHANYRTAWFDPEKRVLALPIWKNRGKAVYDLLTGHEVGHALYTPAKGWHDAIDDIEGAPKAYLNVLEDVRIERKIQDKYPGLRLQFRKAYKQLAEEDFFGLTKIGYDFSSMLAIDKINLKAKLGENVEVEFNHIEQYFYDSAFKTETFEDVVALAKQVYEYQKELYKDAKFEEKPVDINLGDPTEDASDDMDGADPNDYHKPDAKEKEKQEASQDQDFSDSEESDSSKDQKPDAITASKKPEHVAQEELQTNQAIDKPAAKNTIDDSLEALESITDKAFREKEAELTASDEMKGTMVFSINKPRQSVKEIVIDYKEYYNVWNDHIAKVTTDTYYADTIRSRLLELDGEYKRFKLNTEQAAAYMAKEFELRKAAYQYSRSSIHKTGIINTNKLHAYKYSEDIFLKSTKLANYKNHGMMMFIDFSGSMQSNIGPTIRQLLNLTTFCRMVNIPYEVYAFTTRVKYELNEETHQNEDWNSYTDCEVVLQKFNLLNLLSSRMSRTEYQSAMRMLWNLSMAWDGSLHSGYVNAWNHLHSTPLNSSIVYANEMIKDFKAKHGVEKMTTMFLTDGASDSFQVRMTDDGEKHRPVESPIGSYYLRRGKCLMRFAGHTMDVGHTNSHKVTEEMLEVLKKTTGTAVLGFFISQYRNEAVSKICDATSYSKKEKYVDQLNKNRAIIEDKLFGYDRYFGLCQKYMDIVEDEFGEMVEDGASKGKLKTAFAKMTKSKRVNRILLNAFVDAIA